MEFVNDSKLEFTNVEGLKVASFGIPQYGLKEVSKLWNFQKNNELCDATLMAELDDTKVVVHRAMLSLVSEFFRSMFNDNSREGTILLKDISGTALQQIVEFMYTGKITFNETNVLEIFKHSRSYRLPILTSACEKFFMLNIKLSNFMEYKKIAVDYDCWELTEVVKTFQAQHFESIQMSDRLQEMDIDQLKELLSRDTLQCPSEETVFAAVKKWVTFNPQERGRNVMELLPYIRFAFLTPEFITEHSNAFDGSVDAMLYLIKAGHWHRLSDAQKEMGEFTSIPRVYLLQRVQDVETHPVACCNDGVFSYDVAMKLWTKIHRFGDGTIQSASIAGTKIFGYKKEITEMLSYNSRSNPLVLIDLVDDSNSRMLDKYLPGYRFLPAVCAVKDNVYIIGGSKNNVNMLDEALLLDTTNYKARILTFPMVFARKLATAVYFNNCIYVVGGCQFNSSPTNCVEKLDILSERWLSVASLKGARVLPKCIVHKGLLYAIGGYLNIRAECYDPETDLWKFIDNVPSERLSCALIIEDKIVVVTHEGSAYQYNETENRWNYFPGFYSTR